MVYAMHRHGWATPMGSGVWERLTVDVKILADRRPRAERSGAHSGETRALKGLGHRKLCKASSSIALGSESPGLASHHKPLGFELRGGWYADLSWARRGDLAMRVTEQCEIAANCAFRLHKSGQPLS